MRLPILNLTLFIDVGGIAGCKDTSHITYYRQAYTFNHYVIALYWQPLCCETGPIVSTCGTQHGGRFEAISVILNELVSDYLQHAVMG